MGEKIDPEEEPLHASIAVTEVCLGMLGLPSKFEGTPSSAAQWREACEVYGLKPPQLEPIVVQHLIGSQVNKYKLAAPKKDKDKALRRPPKGGVLPDSTPLVEPVADTWQVVPEPEGDQNSLEGSQEGSL